MPDRADRADRAGHTAGHSGKCVVCRAPIGGAARGTPCLLGSPVVCPERHSGTPCRAVVAIDLAAPSEPILIRALRDLLKRLLRDFGIRAHRVALDDGAALARELEALRTAERRLSDLEADRDARRRATAQDLARSVDEQRAPQEERP